MAFAEFIQNIRMATDLLAPRTSADVPAFGAIDPQQAFDFADLWLTPALVKEFDERDFANLPQADRDGLADEVRQFRDAAETVADRGVTQEQVNAALTPFAAIVGLLRPYLLDTETEAIRRAIWREWWPYRDWIPTFEYQLEEDHDGDPIVRIWLILSDNVDIESAELHEHLAEVRREIADSFDRARISRQPLVLVRLRSEVRELLVGGVV